MFDLMNRAKEAIESFEVGLRVHSNNTAHANTPGYKRHQYTFKTIFNQVLQNARQSSGTNQGTRNPFQVGSSVAVSDIEIDFSQGDLVNGAALDIAVFGEGLFIVAGMSEGDKLYTRSGNFKVDASGEYITTMDNNTLYGYKIDSSGNPDTSQMAPIKTDNYADLGWQDGGILVANYKANQDDPTISTIPLYQVALTSFANKGGLLSIDGTKFQEQISSGKPYEPILPGTGSMGDIYAQRREKSNVEYVTESIQSLQAQRALNASLTTLKMASDQIQNVVNKLGA
ncbi:flagellar hook-basal body complex protein [Candidatus Margulisiibacteriota bacterium]